MVDSIIHLSADCDGLVHLKFGYLVKVKPVNNFVGHQQFIVVNVFEFVLTLMMSVNEPPDRPFKKENLLYSSAQLLSWCEQRTRVWTSQPAQVTQEYISVMGSEDQTFFRNLVQIYI